MQIAYAHFPKNPKISEPQHLKEEKEFNLIIETLINEGVSFSTRFIKDQNARARYQKLILEASQKITQEIQSGAITLAEGAQKASRLRNEYLELVRNMTSDIAQAVARFKKPKGYAFGSLVEYYSTKIFQRPFEALSFDTERNSVFKAILEASGRSNSHFSTFAQILGKLGTALAVVSFSVMVYHICESEDKWGTAIQDGTGIALGTAASGIGGWAGTICGPGAIICVPLGVLIGGFLGAYGTDLLFQWRL